MSRTKKRKRRRNPDGRHVVGNAGERRSAFLARANAPDHAVRQELAEAALSPPDPRHHRLANAHGYCVPKNLRTCVCLDCGAAAPSPLDFEAMGETMPCGHPWLRAAVRSNPR